MPNKSSIRQEILTLKNTGQDKVRRRYLTRIANYSKRDTIVYACDSFSARAGSVPPLLYQIAKDDIQGFMSSIHGLKNDNLDLILHSGGGSLEAADLIVYYLRHKYKHIRAIVPMSAMSAATMIACACDEIILTHHSCLGPIDPQITLPRERSFFTAPAFSILEEFEQALESIKDNPDSAVLWGAKIKDYPPGILSICQQVSALSVTKVEEWLKSYMFYGDHDAEEKAARIAAWLGNAKEHKTHGRPITFDVAQEQGLNVKLLEDDNDFQELILSFFHSATTTFEVTNCLKFIENHTGKGVYYTFQPTAQ